MRCVKFASGDISEIALLPRYSFVRLGACSSMPVISVIPRLRASSVFKPNRACVVRASWEERPRISRTVCVKFGSGSETIFARGSRVGTSIGYCSLQEIFPRTSIHRRYTYAFLGTNSVVTNSTVAAACPFKSSQPMKPPVRPEDSLNSEVSNWTW